MEGLGVFREARNVFATVRSAVIVFEPRHGVAPFGENVWTKSTQILLVKP